MLRGAKHSTIEVLAPKEEEEEDYNRTITTVTLHEDQYTFLSRLAQLCI